MTHFVVVLPFALPAVQQNLTATFQREGFAWWHWSGDCWLLAHNNDQLNAVSVRDWILRMFGGVQIQIAVLKIELPKDVPWAVFGPTDWGKWLGEYWENKVR